MPDARRRSRHLRYQPYLPRSALAPAGSANACPHQTGFARGRFQSLRLEAAGALQEHHSPAQHPWPLPCLAARPVAVALCPDRRSAKGHGRIGIPYPSSRFRFSGIPNRPCPGTAHVPHGSAERHPCPHRTGSGRRPFDLAYHRLCRRSCPWPTPRQATPPPELAVRLQQPGSVDDCGDGPVWPPRPRSDHARTDTSPRAGTCLCHACPSRHLACTAGCPGHSERPAARPRRCRRRLCRGSTEPLLLLLLLLLLHCRSCSSLAALGHQP